MLPFVLSLFVIVAVLVAQSGNCSGLSASNAPPEVTAATADWQLSSEPIIVAARSSMPTRATRIFDGQVMTQIGVYQRCPVDADVDTRSHTASSMCPSARNQHARRTNGAATANLAVHHRKSDAVVPRSRVSASVAGTGGAPPVAARARHIVPRAASDERECRAVIAPRTVIEIDSSGRGAAPTACGSTSSARRWYSSRRAPRRVLPPDRFTSSRRVSRLSGVSRSRHGDGSRK